MKHPIVTIGLLAVGLAGCGVEGLFNAHLGEDYTQPVSTIRGTLPFADPQELTVLAPTGNLIEPFEVTVEGDTFEIDLISGNYETLRVVAAKGQLRAMAIVPDLPEESAVDGVVLDAQTTSRTLVVEGLGSAQEPDGEGTLESVSGNLACILGKKFDAAVERGEAYATFQAMAERIFAAADVNIDTVNKVFVRPLVEITEDEETGEETWTILQSPLNDGWLSRNGLDYDDDGTIERTTDDFDAAFVAAMQATGLQAPTDPERIRVVFEVNFNKGRLDGQCNEISRFKWVSDEPGKRMFFVGGIHPSSPVQDTSVDAMLGNTGSWTPNTIPMFDDGTHGDRQSNDGIWTIFFDLPREVRIGYKYTWGQQGDPWTGSEEWPGNQRILEVVDVNEDGYVYRIDDFGDEASNKDLANSAVGSLDWDEDADGDGYAEAREGPADQPAPGTIECNPADDDWVTPEWVPALTLSCDEFTP